MAGGVSRLGATPPSPSSRRPRVGRRSRSRFHGRPARHPGQPRAPFLAEGRRVVGGDGVRSGGPPLRGPCLLLHPPVGKAEGPGTSGGVSRSSRPFITERWIGFEPATPSLGSADPSRPGVISPSQATRILGDSEPEPVQPSQPFAGVRKPFAAPVLQGPAPTRLRALPEAPERLLTVREVAERLGVCTATVYGLCERGELSHVRVSNAIRIRPSDLNAFLERDR